MLHLLYALLATARSSLKPQRETKSPKLTQTDRAFWVAVCHLWPGWQNALLIVKPQTVIGWHRKDFKLYWTWKSRKRTARPPIDAEIRTLIRRIARENPTWGAPRIHGELLMLGFEVGQATLSQNMPLRRTPPSQTWRTFLQNHTQGLVSIDFFVVPTATFRILYVFLALDKDAPEQHQRNSLDGGKVIALPMVGGLHHRYRQRAARAKVSVLHDVGREPRALHGAMADSAKRLAHVEPSERM